MDGARTLRDRLRGLGALSPTEPLPANADETAVSAAMVPAAETPFAPAPSAPPGAEPVRTPYLPPEPPPEPGVEAYLPGFWQDTPEGRIFVVEKRFALDHLHGAIPLGRTLDAPGHIVARIGRNELLSEVPSHRILYLDTETTGLSGGTGTYAFLVGIGHFIDGGFRLRQYFQTDFGQEPALLRALADYMTGFDAVVTFNGKSFDLPLLETRFTLGGLTPRRSGHANPRELPHLDLLHPARRIYRERLVSCRLAELEQHVLGLTRIEAVPSWEIPALYFRYVRTRRFRALEPVFEHNALDVLSLVTLTAHLCDLFGGDGARSAEDRFALGRACAADGLDQQAIANYRAALEIGLVLADQHACEERLSLLYRRLGRWDEAVALWELVRGRERNRRLYPYIELAKYHEHTERDFARALDVAREGLALLERHHLRYGAANAADRTALLARIERLERRLAGGRAKDPAVVSTSTSEYSGDT